MQPEAEPADEAEAKDKERLRQQGLVGIISGIN
jgi:hypothetical protein